MFNKDGGHLGTYTGDATASPWGDIKLNASPDMLKMREQDCGLEREQMFNAPVAATID